MKVLLIKMSSLGDVVHTLPAVTDAVQHGVTLDWVVEEAFQSIPARNASVHKVIPIAWRRWRGNLLANRAALGDFIARLRSERYDLIIDAQGLLKSAAVVVLAKAPVAAGFSFSSAREPAAAFFYGHRIPVPMGGHAIDRLRALFAGALDYQILKAAPDFGLPDPGSGRAVDRCLLLHGTTWASKHWPLQMWQAQAIRLVEAGWRVEVPWGDEAERSRATEIAAVSDGVRVLDAMNLDALVDHIARVGLVVGVDSGLTHLAAALAVPTLVLYGATSALMTGARGSRVVNLQSDLGCSPCLRRQCRYSGEPLRWQGEAVSPACYAGLNPERVSAQVIRLLEDPA